jgi:hypothetical protein
MRTIVMQAHVQACCWPTGAFIVDARDGWPILTRRHEGALDHLLQGRLFARSLLFALAFFLFADSLLVIILCTGSNERARVQTSASQDDHEHANSASSLPLSLALPCEASAMRTGQDEGRKYDCAL